MTKELKPATMLAKLIAVVNRTGDALSGLISKPDAHFSNRKPAEAKRRTPGVAFMIKTIQNLLIFFVLALPAVAIDLFVEVLSEFDVSPAITTLLRVVEYAFLLADVLWILRELWRDIGKSLGGLLQTKFHKACFGAILVAVFMLAATNGSPRHPRHFGHAVRYDSSCPGKLQQVQHLPFESIAGLRVV